MTDTTLVTEHLLYEVNMMNYAHWHMCVEQAGLGRSGRVDQGMFNLFHTAFWTHARNVYSFFEQVTYGQFIDREKSSYIPACIQDPKNWKLVKMIDDQVLTLTNNRTAVMEDKLQTPTDSQYFMYTLKAEFTTFLKEAGFDFKLS